MVGDRAVEIVDEAWPDTAGGVEGAPTAARERAAAEALRDAALAVQVRLVASLAVVDDPVAARLVGLAGGEIGLAGHQRVHTGGREVPAVHEVGDAFVDGLGVHRLARGAL